MIIDGEVEVVKRYKVVKNKIEEKKYDYIYELENDYKLYVRTGKEVYLDGKEN